MKRFAGEKNGGGYCSASKRTLMEKLGVGRNALNTSLKYLIDHKWIEKIGTRSVMTNGGAQDIDVYRVNDIWKLNTEYYKGADEIAPLSKGAAETTQGGAETAQGAAEMTSTKNYKTYKTPANADLPHSKEYEYEEEDKKPKKSRRRDKVALALMYRCYDRMESEMGVRPTETFADYNRVLEAQKILKNEQILEMVDDALSKGKAKTLREMLTTRAIDIYRQEYA